MHAKVCIIFYIKHLVKKIFSNHLSFSPHHQKSEKMLFTFIEFNFNQPKIFW